jgi:hypothetical protein
MVMNWIGCQDVLAINPIPVEFDDEIHGAYGLIDHNIRNWIQNNGFGGRAALFPMPLWNMIDRHVYLCGTDF